MELRGTRVATPAESLQEDLVPWRPPDRLRDAGAAAFVGPAVTGAPSLEDARVGAGEIRRAEACVGAGPIITSRRPDDRASCLPTISRAPRETRVAAPAAGPGGPRRGG